MKKLEINVCEFYDWNLNYLTYHEYLIEFLENEICVKGDIISSNRFGYIDKLKQAVYVDRVKAISFEILDVLFSDYITIPSLQKEVAYMVLVAARLIVGFKEGENLKIRQKFKIQISTKSRFEASVNFILNEFGICQEESSLSQGLQYQSTITQNTNENSKENIKLFATPKANVFQSNEVQYMNVKPGNNDISLVSEYELNLKPISLRNVETAPSSQSVVRNLSKEKDYTPSSTRSKKSLISEIGVSPLSGNVSKTMKTLVKKKEGNYGQTMRKDVSFNSEVNFLKRSNYVVLEEKNNNFHLPSPVVRENLVKEEPSYLSRKRYKNRGKLDYESKNNLQEEKSMKNSHTDQQSYLSLADEYKRLKQKNSHIGENFENEIENNPGKLSLSGIGNITIENENKEMRTSNYYQPPKMRYSRRRRSPNIDTQPGWQTDRYANRGKRSPIYPRYNRDRGSMERRESSVERQPLTERSGYYNNNNRSYFGFQRGGQELNQRISNSSFLPKERDYSSRERNYQNRDGSLSRNKRRYSNMNENYYSPCSREEPPVQNFPKKVNVPLLKLSQSRLDSRRSIKRRSPNPYENRVQTSRERTSSRDRGYFGREVPRAPMTDRGHRATRNPESYMKIEGVDDFKDKAYFRKKSKMNSEYYSPIGYNYKSGGARSRENKSYRNIEKINSEIDMRYSNYMGQGTQRRQQQVSPSPIEGHRMMKKSYKMEESSNRFIYGDRKGSVAQRREKSPYQRDYEPMYTPGYIKKIYGEGGNGKGNRYAGKEKYGDYEAKENYGNNTNYYW